MKRFSLLLVPMMIAGGLASRAETHLKVGDKAPNFTLPSTTGKPITLADFAGKQAVVLGFFSAAFTGG